MGEQTVKGQRVSCSLAWVASNECPHENSAERILPDTMLTVKALVEFRTAAFLFYAVQGVHPVLMMLR